MNTDDVGTLSLKEKVYQKTVYEQRGSPVALQHTPATHHLCFVLLDRSLLDTVVVIIP